MVKKLIIIGFLVLILAEAGQAVDPSLNFYFQKGCAVNKGGLSFGVGLDIIELGDWKGEWYIGSDWGVFKYNQNKALVGWSFIWHPEWLENLRFSFGFDFNNGRVYIGIGGE